MKISSSLIISSALSINTVSGFITLPVRNAAISDSVRLSMSDQALEEFTEGSAAEMDTWQQFSSPRVPVLLRDDFEDIPEKATCLNTLQQISFSKAIPFMSRPKYLNGSFAGDVGFDPLGFVKSTEDLIKYREAEIRHARLAMLAAVGWPLSEVLNKKLASIMNLSPALDLNGKAPNPITDFAKIDPYFLLAVVVLGSGVEIYGRTRSFDKVSGYHPGNLGFDPLNLYPEENKEQRLMQKAEIKHGRTAMMAIVFYALEETFTKHGVLPSL